MLYTTLQKMYCYLANAVVYVAPICAMEQPCVRCDATWQAMMCFLCGLQAHVSRNSVPSPVLTEGSKSDGQSLFYVKGGARMTVQNVSFDRNTATVVLHFEGCSFKGTVDNLHLIDNNASGVFFEGAGPKFDGDGVTLSNFIAHRNGLWSRRVDKSPVGALAFKSITSKTGQNYPLLIENSSIEDNYVADAVRLGGKGGDLVNCRRICFASSISDDFLYDEQSTPEVCMVSRLHSNPSLLL
jgi:hypothetical protein